MATPQATHFVHRDSPTWRLCQCSSWLERHGTDTYRTKSDKCFQECQRADCDVLFCPIKIRYTPFTDLPCLQSSVP